jgi:hypothetical protein
MFVINNKFWIYLKIFKLINKFFLILIIKRNIKIFKLINNLFLYCKLKKIKFKYI